MDYSIYNKNENCLKGKIFYIKEGVIDFLLTRLR